MVLEFTVNIHSGSILQHLNIKNSYRDPGSPYVGNIRCSEQCG